jgi:hypothetical protein
MAVKTGMISIKKPEMKLSGNILRYYNAENRINPLIFIF